MPARPQADDEGLPRYLDEAAVQTPTAAISNAAREALRMSDIVARMLRGLENLFLFDDRRRIAEIRRTDDLVDRLNHAVQSYLTRISREELGDDDRERLNEVQVFAINMEHIGDTIEKSLLQLAAKRLKGRLTFSSEGLSDIEAMRAMLLEHLQLAANVFVSADAELARRLVAEKDRFRALENESRASHFARKQAGRAESLETTSLHVDIVRDFKQIEGFIAATVYPLLERTGQLASSRLKAAS
jgi:phosphate:Na+ symporter